MPRSGSYLEGHGSRCSQRLQGVIVLCHHRLGINRVINEVFPVGRATPRTSRGPRLQHHTKYSFEAAQTACFPLPASGRTAHRDPLSNAANTA